MIDDLTHTIFGVLRIRGVAGIREALTSNWTTSADNPKSGELRAPCRDGDQIAVLCERERDLPADTG